MQKHQHFDPLALWMDVFPNKVAQQGATAGLYTHTSWRDMLEGGNTITFIHTA